MSQGEEFEKEKLKESPKSETRVRDNSEFKKTENQIECKGRRN